MEAHFYTFLNGGDFNLNHLEEARSVLGAITLDGHGLIDVQLVEGDVTNPAPRGEALVDHQLTAAELEELSERGIETIDGPLQRAAQGPVLL